MWRQQVKQRLDAAEEQRHETLDAAFSPEDRLQTLGRVLHQPLLKDFLLSMETTDQPSEIQLLVKEEEPSSGVDQQDSEPLHIKEEEEELWIGLKEELLTVTEETDATWFPLTAAPVKSEDDEEKPLFSQLHQAEDRDLPTSSSADQVKADTDGGEESSRMLQRCRDLSTHGDTSNSSETQDSEDDEESEDESGGNAVGRPFSCSDCDQQYVNKGCLQRDTAGPSRQRSSRCSRCFKEKNDVDPLREDQTGLKSCGDCGKHFKRKDHLEIHMRIHTGEKPFSCDVCEQRFNQKTSLNRHRRIHTGHKPFSCDFCGRGFILKAVLKDHLRIHTGQKPFRCDVCEKTFSQKPSLNRHVKIHVRRDSFSFGVSGQMFTPQSSDPRIHRGQKPFHCDDCGQRFDRTSNLKAHLRVHRGEKPFCCDVCGQTFGQKSNLNSHRRIHTGERPFHCGVCGQTFRHKPNFNVHMRMHTGTKT